MNFNKIQTSTRENWFLVNLCICMYILFLVRKESFNLFWKGFSFFIVCLLGRKKEKIKNEMDMDMDMDFQTSQTGSSSSFSTPKKVRYIYEKGSVFLLLFSNAKSDLNLSIILSKLAIIKINKIKNYSHLNTIHDPSSANKLDIKSNQKIQISKKCK